MATGTPYFAWVNPNETTFLVGHQRWDENVFSFTLAQEEGSFASLTVVVRRPNGGLLCPDRKIWAWFALDCGTELIKFFGRLVGIPTSIFEELVTLEFIARPIDYTGQKADLANTLRVLPYYDEVVIDPQRRDDPDVVLEGYTAIWHIDRETHAVTVSDEIIGEDGLVEFDGVSADGKVLYEGLGLSLSSGPLASVEINAEYEWTQTAAGTVDLTEYLTDNWPNEGFVGDGIITSFTYGANNWPKNGAGIGDGWKAFDATCSEVYDLEVQNKHEGSKTTMKWTDGETTTVEKTTTTNFLKEIPPGSIEYPRLTTQDDVSIKWADDGDGGRVLTSYSRQTNVVPSVLPLHHLRATLIAEYESGRRCTERVSFTLFADVQSILTDPEDGEALRLDDIRSVNLSETIGEGTDSYIPIVDPSRRSYITTERGLDSLEHLIALATAHLMKRSRVVEITFAPPLSRMPEITLRKNVLLNEPRIGEALGKVIGYSLALNGSDGRINCEVRIGCTIGRGGSAVATGGEPTYCSITYCGNDYQQFTGKTVLFDSSVGYQPPNSNPNDDGIDFQSTLFAADVIEQALVVENPPASQRTDIEEALEGWGAPFPIGATNEQRQELVTARAEAVNNALKEIETRATFKLKSMKREFVTDYQVQVTDLKIPTGIDLEVCDDTPDENVSVSPAAANLVLSATAPTSSVASGSIALSPASGNLIFSTTAPVIAGGTASLSPVSGNLLLSTTPPTFSIAGGSVSLSPVTRNLTLSTTSPTVDDGSEEGFAFGFVGPFDTVAETEALGATFEEWEARFASYAEDHNTSGFTMSPGSGSAGAGYDMAKIYYVWYERTGNAAYLSRANALAVEFVANNDTGTTSPFRQWEGLAIHYLYTGDTDTLELIGDVADIAAFQQDQGEMADTTLTGNDARVSARWLAAVLAAHVTNAPSDGAPGGFPGGNDWDAVLPLMLADVLSTQHANGYWTFTHTEPVAWTEIYPYSNALLCDTLITYYHYFDADPDIVTAVQKYVDWAWTQVRDMAGTNTTNTFHYIPQRNTYDPPEDRSETNGSPDLVMWPCNAFYFVYHATGDVTYKSRGDALFVIAAQGDAEGAGGSPNYQLWKQFQEVFTSSYRGPYYREATPLATPAYPVNSVVPVITGTASQGNVLTCGNGTWSNTPTSRSYQWYRYQLEDSSLLLAQPIGTNANTFTLTASEVGWKVFCVQRAINASGTSAPVPTALTATVT